MCLLCVEIAKGNMTNKEIARAYMEITVEDTDHIGTLMVKLTEAGKIEAVAEELTLLYNSDND